MDKETWHDINTFVAKYKSTILYILKERETEIQVSHVGEASQLACLINSLKDNKFEKIEHLTLNEFSDIYRKSIMQSSASRETE